MTLFGHENIDCILIDRELKLIFLEFEYLKQFDNKLSFNLCFVKNEIILNEENFVKFVAKVAIICR